MAIKTLRTQIGQEPQFDNFSVHGLCQPPEATRSTQDWDSLPVQGKIPLPSMHYVLKDQEWCIYGMIYHYAPFLLRNPMVTFSGPNSMIPNQGPKIHHQFQRRILQLISLAIYGSYQKTSRTPTTWPCRSWAGNSFRIIPRAFLRGYSSFNQF
ncbi:hypothetical protein O181_002697 [Austropuccinia psidii MF-1]|uniref:Uncharacterized protein n=1 Tax=Austropuccinia psidii MF-1 TaxID=1389203 RepID=A0A9Q3BCZ3_9BASI|nr:hypothetical protein [Austropuccinia psidii MF-1]